MQRWRAGAEDDLRCGPRTAPRNKLTDAEEQRILALKSSVHFRADFEPIAREVLVVKAPGPALADPAEFKWTRLRKGVRLRPLGPALT